MTEHRLLELLKEHNLKIATAESCTGGLVSGVLCDIAGISKYFEEGFVTYSEDAKIKNLGVLPETIEHYGVVSCEVAEEMAMGAAERANANCAIATTGIAGPTGGTDTKPVGLVYMGVSLDGETTVVKKIFTGTRKEVRTQTVETVFVEVKKRLQI